MQKGKGTNSCRDQGHVRAAKENSQASSPSGSLTVDSHLHCGFALDERANKGSSESQVLARNFSVKRKMNKLNSAFLLLFIPLAQRTTEISEFPKDLLFVLVSTPE